MLGICMGKKLNDIGIKYTIWEKSNTLGNYVGKQTVLKK